MKAAIVTGASGFIGGAVVRELLANGYKVYAIVREGRENTLPNEENCVPVVCDMDEASKLEDTIPKNEAQIFFHFAWAGVSGPAKTIARVQLTNAQWTVDCVKIAKDLGCSRFVCSGTISEHEVLSLLYSPGVPPESRCIYGTAKIAARAMGLKKAAEVGIDPVWGVIINAYGPGDHTSNIIVSAARKVLAHSAPEFTDGSQNYDFIYIDDVARAFRLLGEKGRPYYAYTLGSGHARHLREFLLDMKAAIASDLDFKFGAIPFVGKSLPLSAFDCSETERDTGFKAEMPFNEGCRRLYEWLKREARL